MATLERASTLQRQTPDARLHAQIQLACGIALHQLRRLSASVDALEEALAALLATLAIHQWRSTRRMRTLAMTDELTGVPNRRALLTRLAPLVDVPNGRTHAMLIIDIDHFKSINDQYGHPEGDDALKLVAARLREGVSEPAFIGRLGGEEFAVVVPDADTEAGRELAERFSESVMTIDMRRWLADRRLTVSIGVTISKLTGDTPSHMLQRADAALYDAKRAGRNCVRQQLPPSQHAQSVRQVPAEIVGPQQVEKPGLL